MPRGFLQQNRCSRTKVPSVTMPYLNSSPTSSVGRVNKKVRLLKTYRQLS